MQFDSILMKIFKISPYIAIFSSLVLIACQTGASNQANGKPLIDKESYRKINITFADTNSAKGRALISALDSYYNSQVAKGFNGSVLVGQKGNILYERYLGFADRQKKTRLDKTYSTQLASTSKPFTATAILWLHQNKYLDINKPVNAYLPDFPYTNITVKMLLNQRSGLPDYTKLGFPKWKNPERPMYNKDLMSYIDRVKPNLLFSPNTRFNYSNTNYAALASIIEAVSGMRYKDFMKDLIFEPLGMTNTFVFDPMDDYSNRKLTTSYKYNWTLFPNTHEDGIYGDKGIYSTVEDMYRWDQSFYNNDILTDKLQKQAYQGYSNEMTGVKNYGFGWRMYDFTNGYKLIYHNGWWHGNNTVFYRFVQDNITVIVLGNKYNSNIYDHGKDVYNIIKKFDNSAVYDFGTDTSGDE